MPSGDVCSWNAFPYAASQRSTIRLMACGAPRSTCSHWGSLNALDHRVVVLPSTALAAARLAFSWDDAVAGFPCDNGTGPVAVGVGVGVEPPATGTTVTSFELGEPPTALAAETK